MGATAQSLIWVAREFAITVLISFLILNAILETFFKASAISSISPIRLLALVVACTVVVFACIACAMGILHLILPTRADTIQEPEDGLIGIEKPKAVEELV